LLRPLDALKRGPFARQDVPMALEGTCWVLTTGEAGMRSQALGLAEAVGLPFVEKRVVLNAPWSWLPGGLLSVPLTAAKFDGAPATPPWPRLVIGCGRRSIGPALAVKRASGGRTLAVYVQNPELAREKFDLVAAMPHDGVTGANVATSATALHRVTEQRLAEARDEWRGRLCADGPVLGVLVGGDNGGYRLTEAVTRQLIRIVERARREHGFSAAVTPSRRTDDAARAMLTKGVTNAGLGTFWDEKGENPYFGILALSDRLIVTAESISMISEALATGRPVHVLSLEGRARRHDAFLTRVVSQGLVSPIDGDDLDWSFTGPGAVNATPAVAERVRALLAAYGGER
jgi:mitochondrial fission protein ELM1